MNAPRNWATQYTMAIYQVENGNQIELMPVSQESIQCFESLTFIETKSYMMAAKVTAGF